MVVLNGLKYACETCIKGHRSSACSHTDRTLFEIKKKGRPITQCEHCRHLRKTRQVHVKCLCGSRSGNEKTNGSRAKLKLPASATIRIDPDDPTHATITTGILPLKSKPKHKPKPKPAENKSCDCGKTGQCDCASESQTTDTRSYRPSPSLPSASVTPPPPSAAPTSSCCSTKSRSPDNDTPAPTSTNDKYTASLLDDLSRVAAYNYNAPPADSNSTSTYHHHVQPFYNPSLSSSSFAWQSGVTLGSCSCGITCACPGCYEHSPSTSMILFAGENCPYSCTTCTECNGFGFNTVPSHAFIVPTHSHNENWRQSSSNTVVSTSALVPTPATSVTGSSLFPSSSRVTVEKPAAISSCCGGPCKCIVCNCSKPRSGDDPPEKIGFAVSGEREGCCTDANPRIRRSNPITFQHRPHSIDTPELIT